MLYVVRPFDINIDYYNTLGWLVLSVTEQEYFDTSENEVRLINGASSIYTTSGRIINYLEKNDLLTFEILKKMRFLSKRSFAYFEQYYQKLGCIPKYIGNGSVESLVQSNKLDDYCNDSSQYDIYLRGEEISSSLSDLYGQIGINNRLHEIVGYRTKESKPRVNGLEVKNSDLNFSGVFAFYSGSSVRCFYQIFAPANFRAISFGPSSLSELLKIKCVTLVKSASIEVEKEVLNQIAQSY